LLGFRATNVPAQLLLGQGISVRRSTARCDASSPDKFKALTVQHGDGDLDEVTDDRSTSPTDVATSVNFDNFDLDERRIDGPRRAISVLPALIDP